jgi:hypothetical protein
MTYYTFDNYYEKRRRKEYCCCGIEESLWVVETGMRTIGIGFPSLIGEKGLFHQRSSSLSRLPALRGLSGLLAG